MRRSTIPSFALYGEAAAPGQELLHIEAVASRSRLYHWEISPHRHQGLYQVLWLQRGVAEVVLDEWVQKVQGPAAIVVPPGVVHGFRFAPGTDGLVLTLSARFLVEGEFQSVGESFRALFAAPGVLDLQDQPVAAERLQGLLHELAAEFAQPGAGDSPVPGWLARADAALYQAKAQG
ncbi:MAG: AraC family ligand binding domain-containing protein, partial [Curvibacter sp.]